MLLHSNNNPQVDMLLHSNNNPQVDMLLHYPNSEPTRVFAFTS
jgi:hypothetical protein